MFKNRPPYKLRKDEEAQGSLCNPKVSVLLLSFWDFSTR